MARKPNPKLIGGFVVGAVALAIAGVIAFGGGRFLATTQRAVLFFPGSSLAGLDVGAPVTFRGVKIGSVVGLVIQYDVDKQNLQIPVTIEIESDKIEIVSGHPDARNIEALVARGLRAQLVVQSLVTGQASVEFNFHPDTPIRLMGAGRGERELPTIPSDIDTLKANISSVLKKIAELPLEQIVAESLQTMQEAHAFVGNLNAQVEPRFNDLKVVTDEAVATLKEARARLELRDGEPMHNVNKTLTDAQRLINNVDKGVAPVLVGADRLVKTTLATLEQAQRTLQTAQSAISPDSALYLQLNRTLVDIQATANSIRVLAEYIQRNPNALLTGKRLP